MYSMCPLRHTTFGYTPTDNVLPLLGPIDRSGGCAYGCGCQSDPNITEER
jgi:hypothetical protein